MIECLILFTFQGFLGAFDVLYHHELTERLPWKISAKKELFIHGIRGFFYCIIFISLGWITFNGVYAWIFLVVLLAEILLTLWDFVIEDNTRKLPATERITHTILAINFGAILAFLVPILINNAASPTGFYNVYYGMLSWIMTFYGMGVLFWAGRDLLSSYGLNQKIVFPIIHLSHKKMKILVTGGSGFIGSKLCQSLINADHDVTIFTRHKAKTAAKFIGKITLIDSLYHMTESYDVIINLAGESLSEGSWTEKKKKSIYMSRVETTQMLIDYIASIEKKPKLLISGSAIGYYGSSLDREFTELELPNEKDFAHDLCSRWEEKANQVKKHGVRVCFLRTGIVLGIDGGVLSKMLFPFTFCLGGKMGNGKQWMSWIHLDDLIGLIAHMINEPTLEGPVNGTAPFPVSNEVFVQALGKAMHRPAIFTIPAFALTLFFGEMAEILLLKGQKVIPQKAIQSGYIFQYKNIENALKNIFK